MASKTHLSPPGTSGYLTPVINGLMVARMSAAWGGILPQPEVSCVP